MSFNLKCYQTLCDSYSEGSRQLIQKKNTNSPQAQNSRALQTAAAPGALAWAR